jgi:hypothetical protein
MADEIKYEDRFLNTLSKEDLLKGKNPEEIIAIKYFQYVDDGGCFGSKYISDEEFLVIQNKAVGSLEDRKSQALNKLGIDIDQVSEIEPVGFQGYAWMADEIEAMKKNYVRFPGAGGVITPTKELTWLFFGDQQLFVYKCRVDMCDSQLRSEKTLEYFYKDITAFSTESSSHREKKGTLENGCGSSTWEYSDQTIQEEKFKIVVPGEVFSCAMSPEDDNDNKISGMKQKLRDKKNT